MVRERRTHCESCNTTPATHVRGVRSGGAGGGGRGPSGVPAAGASVERATQVIVVASPTLHLPAPLPVVSPTPQNGAMDAVRLLWRSRLRRRWRSWLAVALLLGLGAGTGLACLAGARRTASSFDRIAAATDVWDINTSHGETPAEAIPVIDRFEGVETHYTQVGFVGFVEGLDPSFIKYYLGGWDRPLRSILLDGRHPRPDRADEVLVSGIGAAKAGIAPGDRLTVRLLGGEQFDQQVAKRVTVTGIGAESLDVAADAAYDRSAIIFTPAFVRENASDLQAWSSTRLVAAPGTANEVLVSQIQESGWNADEVFADVRSRVQDALRPLTITLGLLGSLVLLATLVVVGQALARQSDAGSDEANAVRSMGFSPSQSRALDVFSLASVALPGATVAVAVAIALSPLFPAGSVRRLEPERGLSADFTVLAVGTLTVVVALLLFDRFGAGRSTRVRSVAPPRLAALAAAGAPIGAGVRLAVGGTNVERRRFWTTVALSASALAMVVGGLAFVGALDRVSDEPARYGVGWDLTTRNAFGEVPPDEVRDLVRDVDEIEGVAGSGVTPVLINGEVAVPAMPFLPITAEIWPTVVRGTTPRNDDEVLVGEAVMERIGGAIGDTLRIELPFGGTDGGGDPEGEPPEVKVVGVAIFPSVELAGADPTRLDNGLAMTWARYQSLRDAAAEFGDSMPDLILFDLAEGTEAASMIKQFPEGMPEVGGFAPTEWLPSLAPAEVLETDRATPLIWAVIVFLGVTVVATIGHAVATTVRRRRGDYAVLKALGFQRRQVLSAVAFQSTATVVLALLMGVPVGVALGRSAWRIFADLIGVVDSPLVPVAALVVVVVGALAVTALVAMIPGVKAGRVPALVLRDE